MSGGSQPAIAGMSSRITTATPATGAPIVLMRGEIDAGCAEELRRILRHLGRQHRSVVLDATDATCIDGAVLIVVVAASQRLPGGVWVRGAAGAVRRVFVLAGLEHMLLS